MQRGQGHRLETAFERRDDIITLSHITHYIYMSIMVSQQMLCVLRRLTGEQNGRSMRDMAGDGRE